jgi:flagellar basal-body rod modification protein FlgD
MSAVTSANSLYQQLASESQNGTTTNSSTSANSLASQSTFLELLVAQLKNQDPTQPVDGTTFVTQLAEFSNVEQSLAMRQDLDSMSLKYDGSNSTTPTSSTTSSSSDSTNQSSDNGNSGTSGTNGSSGSQTN